MTAFVARAGTGLLRGDDVGEGDPLVFLHGFSLDRRMWVHQTSALSESRRVVTYDLRGFGESSPPEPVRHHADDLIELLEYQQFDRPVDLVGLSLGANVALAVAVMSPERVRRLVLASPGLTGHRWSETRPPDAALAYARVHSVEETKEYWLRHPIFASLNQHPDASDRVRQMITDYSGEHWRGRHVTAPLPSVMSRLADTALPVLIINGEWDVPGYLDIGNVLVESIAGAERVVLAQCGHMAPLEQPEKFNELLRRFLA
ncbi:pimeloyl-ACP methyl ester carboxylesterase [Amycolatopsis bartoniae]|uniref:Alpha/beta hydrolase n=1 Tax=Amycolatopsis bartoniae TaxID=941986 RepID=A0A8H9J5F7_9PSEU|nr:alpha/beta fold hydrolase [Amycolatopsis bartoniae]MBB2938743.1 pimeloyl-ACP methyl ester carboxylesterase [Amycolatopsis bartoniae]TVT11478.1 alpha/beta fold hydrolase [Amycolatopsis bartoniae]GHF79843.1 alpha/beta hydrolase [Amycolatopsis bartoniae]